MVVIVVVIEKNKVQIFKKKDIYYIKNINN